MSLHSSVCVVDSSFSREGSRGHHHHTWSRTPFARGQRGRGKGVQHTRGTQRKEDGAVEIELPSFLVVIFFQGLMCFYLKVWLYWHDTMFHRWICKRISNRCRQNFVDYFVRVSGFCFVVCLWWNIGNNCKCMRPNFCSSWRKRKGQRSWCHFLISREISFKMVLWCLIIWRRPFTSAAFSPDFSTGES